MKEEATDLAQIAVTLLESPGFVVNRTKSVLEPCQEMLFLGFCINLLYMTVQVPQQKLVKCNRRQATC